VSFLTEDRSLVVIPKVGSLFRGLYEVCCFDLGRKEYAGLRTSQRRGSLALSRMELKSYISQAFVLQVEALSLSNCTVRGFVSLSIHVLGQVYVANSIFTENARGVFSSLARGSNVTVTQSQFYHNAMHSGAVFFLYPLTGMEVSQFFISDCVFEGNGVLV